MDAPEDRELTLQRASADLLAEFSTSIQNLLWITPKVELQDGQTPNPVVRKCVREIKIDHLVKLVCLVLDGAIILRPFDDFCFSGSWSLFRNGHNYSILISVASFRL